MLHAEEQKKLFKGLKGEVLHHCLCSSEDAAL